LRNCVLISCESETFVVGMRLEGVGEVCEECWGR
jgi:hypothetical protein